MSTGFIQSFTNADKAVTIRKGCDCRFFSKETLIKSSDRIA